jgi:hypothetical protein
MTQSKKPDFESTINIDTTDSMGTITITGTNDMDSSWVSVGDITTSTIDIDSIISSNGNITFDWDNINITPTLWQDTLPDVDTVNKMCEEYPALAKAYENFQTVYKLVEQDYKGKQEEEDL